MKRTLTTHSHLHAWRKRCATLAASTLLALMVSGLHGPAAWANEEEELEEAFEAAACTPVMGILPASHQHRDMAQGLLNKPLADRDSSGLSRAELWYEIPSNAFPGGVHLVSVLPLPDGGLYAVSAFGCFFNGCPVTGDRLRPGNFFQTWERKTISGFTTYTSKAAGANRRITYHPGDSTARYRLGNAGADGQLFKLKTGGCLEFPG